HPREVPMVRRLALVVFASGCVAGSAVDSTDNNLVQSDQAAIYFHPQNTARNAQNVLLRQACSPTAPFTCPVVNSTLTIVRNDGLDDNALTISWDTDKLLVGHAVTIHAYVYNDPTKCVVPDAARNLKCTPADVNNQTAGV